MAGNVAPDSLLLPLVHVAETYLSHACDWPVVKADTVGPSLNGHLAFLLL